MAARKKKATRKAAPAGKKAGTKKKKRPAKRSRTPTGRTPPAAQPTAREVLEANERALEIVKMRHQGLTIRRIADRLECSPSTVHYWLVQAAQVYKSEYLQAWEELRFATAHQLDELIACNFAAACAGDKNAGSIVLRAMSQRSVLHGLNAEKATGPAGDNEPNPYDGITEHERARLLFGLLERAGEDAIELVAVAIDRARAAAGKTPIQGTAIRKKTGR